MYPEEHEKKKNLEKSVDRCISMPRNLFFEYSQAWTLLTITKQRKEESFLKNYSIFSTLSKIIIRVLKIPKQRAIVHFRDRTSFHGCSPTVILRANLADRKKRPGVESFPARTKLFSNGQVGAYNFSPRPTNSVKQFLPLLFRSSLIYRARAIREAYLPVGAKSFGPKRKREPIAGQPETVPAVSFISTLPRPFCGGRLCGEHRQKTNFPRRAKFNLSHSPLPSFFINCPFLWETE